VKRWTINRIRTDDGLIGMYIEHDCSEGEKFVHIDTPFVLASDYEALVAALEKYGTHTAGCNSIPKWRDGSFPCDCGFAAALSSAKGTQG
jgi:hypothetical protein